MNLALFSLAIIGGLAAVGGAIRLLVRGPRLLAIPLGYLGLVAFTWLAMASKPVGYRAKPTPDHYASTRPTEGPVDDFVTSDTCRSCHPDEHHSWHASYHRTMTQVATQETVKGDFENEFVGKYPGIEVRLNRDSEGFWATYTTPSPQGAGFANVRRQPIVMTTGSHHYQVYWTGGPWADDERQGDRSVYMVPFVYLFDEQQWIPRVASFLTPPSDRPISARWNNKCIRCHSTQGISRTNPGDMFHDTRTVELGISCEACHGPGKAHVEANRDPLRRYALHRGDGGDPTIVNPARLDHERSSETCGQCHSVFSSHDEEQTKRWNENGREYRPGEALEDSYFLFHPGRPGVEAVQEHIPEFYEGLFWSDGMIRVAGREYHGLLDSPCFQRGEMSCLSCHSLHKDPTDPRPDREWANDQMHFGMRGNSACTQCHSSFSEPEALTAHTHHRADSSGSNCYNCHMPHTTYGLLKGIRSHQIDSPSVKSSLDTGRPNACNLCHLDRTLAWTGESLSDWYGQAQPALTEDETNVAASLLWLLKGDAGQRALVASAMARTDPKAASGWDWMPPFLGQIHHDPYPAVQIIANKALRTLEGYENLPRFPDTRQAADRAYRIWRKEGSSRAGDAVLLMDGRGQIDLAEMLRLMKMRDNKRINLKE